MEFAATTLSIFGKLEDQGMVKKSKKLKYPDL